MRGITTRTNTSKNIMTTLNESVNNDPFKVAQEFASVVDNAIEADKWNSTNDRDVRENMIRPAIQNWWDTKGKNYDPETLSDMFDFLEDWNYHTPSAILDDIMHNRETINNETVLNTLMDFLNLDKAEEYAKEDEDLNLYLGRYIESGKLSPVRANCDEHTLQYIVYLLRQDRKAFESLKRICEEHKGETIIG